VAYGINVTNAVVAVAGYAAGQVIKQLSHPSWVKADLVPYLNRTMGFHVGQAARPDLHYSILGIINKHCVQESDNEIIGEAGSCR